MDLSLGVLREPSMPKHARSTAARTASDSVIATTSSTICDTMRDLCTRRVELLRTSTDRARSL